MRHLILLTISLLACGQPHQGGGAEDLGPSNTNGGDTDVTEGDSDPVETDYDENLCDDAPVLGSWTGVFFGTVDTILGSGFEVQNGTLTLELTCTGIREVTVAGEVSGSACNGMICADYLAEIHGKYVEPAIEADLTGNADYFGMANAAFTGELAGLYTAGGSGSDDDTLSGDWSITGTELLTGGSGQWLACPTDSGVSCTP